MNRLKALLQRIAAIRIFCIDKNYKLLYATNALPNVRACKSQ